MLGGSAISEVAFSSLDIRDVVIVVPIPGDGVTGAIWTLKKVDGTWSLASDNNNWIIKTKDGSWTIPAIDINWILGSRLDTWRL